MTIILPRLAIALLAGAAVSSASWSQNQRSARPEILRAEQPGAFQLYTPAPRSWLSRNDRRLDETFKPSKRTLATPLLVAEVHQQTGLHLVVPAEAQRDRLPFETERPVRETLDWLAARWRGEWVRVGGIYVFQPPAPVTALWEMPERERESLLSDTLEQIVPLLTPGQGRLLAADQPLTIAQVSARQAELRRTMSVLGALSLLRSPLPAERDVLSGFGIRLKLAGDRQSLEAEYLTWASPQRFRKGGEPIEEPGGPAKTWRALR